jgi:hypothetical protein
METSIGFPDPEHIQKRINLCRAELAELKRVLRASLAAQKADEARQLRDGLCPSRQEAGRASR